MGKRSYRRSTRREKENNVGCMWGLIRMLYFRRVPKFLLDRKQGRRWHTVREIADRGHSKNKSRDFEEIDEDENSMEECTAKRTTVRKLMEDELGKVKLLKKIPNDEVERILADLGHDVCLDKSSTQTSKPKVAKNDYTDISTGFPSGSLDTGDSKSKKQAEENDLEFVLADFLGEIHRYHDECPHGDCKNKSELCPALKALIHKKLNDLNSTPCSLDWEQASESGEKKLLGDKCLSSSMAAQSEKFTDALEILSSNKELFIKLLQKPNLHMVENIQKHQNRTPGTKLEPTKNLERNNFVQEIKSPNQDELAIRTQGKESRHIFFWKKDKSNRRQIPEGTNSSQPISKIVILKPNPGRGTDPALSTSSRSLHQQPSTSQAPEYSGRENSKFSIKEVRRRFRIVTGEIRKDRGPVPADDLLRDPRRLRDSVVAMKKDTRHFSEQSLAEKSLTMAKKNSIPSPSSKQKQQNGNQSESSSHIIASKDASVFYEEAKKHLTELLKDKSQTANYPTVQVSKSLEGMLSLPQCGMSPPKSSLRVKDRRDISTERTIASPIDKVWIEESANDISQSAENSESVVCGTGAAVDEAVAVQKGHRVKEETTQHGTRTDEIDTMHIEGTDKLDCSESKCNEQYIPAMQFRHDPLPEMIEEGETENEHVQMLPRSPENIVEKLEQQDPKTPESTASNELISHGSPERIHEKQEQPSPVSVLDLYEDVDSPECKRTTKCELYEDLPRPKYFQETESDLRIFWEDKSVRLDYINLVLELSDLCAEQNLEVWYLEDELISPCLFDELQNQDDHIDDLKALFDCICEALTVIQERYFRFSPWLSFVRHNVQTPPKGGNLISEINKYVEGCLQHQIPSTLDQIVKKDLEDGTWMDLRSESEGIIVEIWEFVLDELMDEAVFDLWI